MLDGISLILIALPPSEFVELNPFHLSSCSHSSLRIFRFALCGNAVYLFTDQMQLLRVLFRRNCLDQLLPSRIFVHNFLLFLASLTTSVASPSVRLNVHPYDNNQIWALL